MATGKGFASSMAVKKAATWGTPVLCGAGDQVEYNSEGLTPDAQFIPDEGLSGESSRLVGDKGNEFHSGVIEADARYEGVGVLLAHALGTAGVPVQEGADDAYRHTLLPNNEMDGVFVTLAIDKLVAVWEYTTAKVNGFSFSCANGERGKFTFPMIPQGLNINTATGTNNNTTQATWTLPTNRDFAKFNQMTVLINTQGGAALTGGTDDAYVSSFETNITRAFPTDDVTTQFGNLIDEPAQDGFDDTGGTLAFSRYHDGAGGNTALIDALLSKATFKMSAVFVGPIADGSATFRLEYHYPAVQFTTGDVNIGGPQRVPVNLNFSAARVLVAPTGFIASHVHGINTVLVNQVPTDLLV